MLNHVLLALATAAAQAGGAQTTGPGSATTDAAAPRLIDPATLPEDERVTAPLTPDRPAQSEPEATARPSGFTLDTPIATLLADPTAKAVLDRDLPGLSEDPNLAKFEAMSLRQFQPLTGGQLDEALLTKVGSDLAAIVSGSRTDNDRARRPVAEGR